MVKRPESAVEANSLNQPPYRLAPQPRPIPMTVERHKRSATFLWRACCGGSFLRSSVSHSSSPSLIHSSVTGTALTTMLSLAVSIIDGAHAIFYFRQSLSVRDRASVFKVPPNGGTSFRTLSGTRPLAVIGLDAGARLRRSSPWPRSPRCSWSSPVFVLTADRSRPMCHRYLCVALLLHCRGLRQERIPLVLAGAALLGLGVNLRETVGFGLLVIAHSSWLNLAAPDLIGCFRACYFRLCIRLVLLLDN